MTIITNPDARTKGDRTKRRCLSIGAAIALQALAWNADAHQGTHGEPADIGRRASAADATRVVEVTMDDTMRFRPASIAVSRGDTVRFVLRNGGSMQHEFVLGNERQLASHAAMMRRMPTMRHTDPNMMAVAAGRTGELVWHFDRSGEVGFACLQPGHYDAGMKGVVVVSAPDAPATPRRTAKPK